MIAYVLALMLSLAPVSSARATFWQTADDITTECTEQKAMPAKECAAVVVAMSFFESSFHRYAVGDSGASLGLMQIHRSNFQSLGVTADDMRAPRLNIRAWLRLVARNNPTAPLEHRIGYGLMTQSQAKARARLATRLMNLHSAESTAETQPE